MSHSRGTGPCCGRTAARPRITRPLPNARSTEATLNPTSKQLSQFTPRPVDSHQRLFASTRCRRQRRLHVRRPNRHRTDRLIRFSAPRPSNQVPGGASIEPRRYWSANLFIVPIGRVANASCFQSGNSGVNRIHPLANTTVYAVMSAARARTTPFGVCSRTASACQWTFLTGVDSKILIPAPNRRTKLPNPRGNR